MSEQNNKDGRPTKLTPELMDKICNYIREGNYAITACRLAGISERAYYYWKERGEKGDGIYVEFLEKVEQADAEAEAYLLSKMYDAAPPDWRAAETTLARRWPGRWARKDKHEVDIQTTRIVNFKVRRDATTEEE